jgi:hypothetical protein
MINYPIKVYYVDNQYYHGPDIRGSVGELILDAPTHKDESHKIQNNQLIVTIDAWEHDIIYKYYLNKKEAYKKGRELTEKALESARNVVASLEKRLKELNDQNKSKSQ